MTTTNKTDALPLHPPLYDTIPLPTGCTAVYALSAFLLAAIIMVPGQARAGQLVYEPRNPSFGGAPFNSAHLLSLADKQNQHREESSSSLQRSPGDNLVRRLESSISSAIARQAVDVILGEGENVQDSGTIQFGDMQVDFDRGVENLELHILDLAAGTETVVNVPLILVE